jgi:arylsulfatase
MKMAIHAAMITRMDREIGRVIDQLKAMDAFRNTLVLFASDNGASSEQLIRAGGHDASAPPGSARSHLCLGPGWSSAANAPFRLHKSWVHEGGISSPLIVHWPAGIKERGQLRHDPCHLVDVTPTLVDLAGGDSGLRESSDIPPAACRSLAPAFRKGGTVGHDYLYFNHANNRALRTGSWKLVAAGAEGPWELYDMRTDRCERRNLVAAQPALAGELADLWRKRDQEYVRQREEAPPTGKPRLEKMR